MEKLLKEKINEILEHTENFYFWCGSHNKSKINKKIASKFGFKTIKEAKENYVNFNVWYKPENKNQQLYKDAICLKEILVEGINYRSDFKLLKKYLKISFRKKGSFIYEEKEYTKHCANWGAYAPDYSIVLYDRYSLKIDDTEIFVDIKAGKSKYIASRINTANNILKEMGSVTFDGKKYSLKGKRFL